MRNTLFAAIAALALAGSSSLAAQAVPHMASAPVASATVRPYDEASGPLEVIVTRPVGQHLYVQTNRPAYIALFEIVPGGSVMLAHPLSRQRMLSGLNRVPVWWDSQTVATGDVKPVSATTDRVRYIYAIASDEPLRLDDSAFVRGAVVKVAGIDASSSRSPYRVMSALSKRFVPKVRDEQWAEAVYELAPRTADQGGVARAYCEYGTIWEIPEEIVDRALCHTSAYGGATPNPARPDSVITPTGERIVSPAVHVPSGLGRVNAPKAGESTSSDAKSSKPLGSIAKGPVPPQPE
jgi:hypothetical protein